MSSWHSSECAFLGRHVSSGFRRFNSARQQISLTPNRGTAAVGSAPNGAYAAVFGGTPSDDAGDRDRHLRGRCVQGEVIARRTSDSTPCGSFVASTREILHSARVSALRLRRHDESLIV